MATGPGKFLNRELSWLEFNQRVLDEAISPDVPLMDRLFFLTITSANLDEFFMVRVGGLELQKEAGIAPRYASGLSPKAALTRISKRIRSMVADQYDCCQDILSALSKAGIRFLQPGEITATTDNGLRAYIDRELLTILSPMPLEKAQCFPLIRNLDMYIAVSFKPDAEKNKSRYAAIPVGKGINRLRQVYTGNDEHTFVLVEDLVVSHIQEFFPGREIIEAVPFRVTRNAGMGVEDEFAEDLIHEMQRILKQRKTSGCVRLELSSKASKELEQFLTEALGISNNMVFRTRGLIDLTGLQSIAGLDGFGELHYEPWPPQPSSSVDPAKSMFEQIAARDILLSHPFNSFAPVVRFLEEASTDPNVLAIKQVLYRTSPDSPIISALRRAAENGKYVTAIVELKARFDEARNISWAQHLEEAGVQVIYGMKNLKTHSKICMVVRREADGIVRYMHFGTGNYNGRTARLYTDVGLLTSNRDLGSDASTFFNSLTGQSDPRPYLAISQSPIGLRTKLTEMIAAEAARRKQGHKARIMAKLNSLVDPCIIEALYEASRAGVEILLNVRGICCLVPGVEGMSENIRVVSIIDRFLEHSRIFFFHHGGMKRVFISSADWMPRNLDRRVELLVPVHDKRCKKQLLDILDACFADNVKARQMLPDGTYRPVTRQGKARRMRTQEALYQNACSAAEHMRRNRRMVLEPHTSPKRRQAKKK